MYILVYDEFINKCFYFFIQNDENETAAKGRARAHASGGLRSHYRIDYEKIYIGGCGCSTSTHTCPNFVEHADSASAQVKVNVRIRI